MGVKLLNTLKGLKRLLVRVLIHFKNLLAKTHFSYDPLLGQTLCKCLQEVQNRRMFYSF